MLWCISSLQSWSDRQDDADFRERGWWQLALRVRYSWHPCWWPLPKHTGPR
eukprot:COSAG02_NODE_55892_length_288_cov_0.804233_1_plen_50_part_10